MLNLLMNTGDALDGPGRIEITGNLEKDEVRVTVRDNAGGIAPENLDKIFDPFFTTKPLGKGTGLGLSISYGIIKDHDGRIEVESTPGEGTAFTIVLPHYS